MNKLVKLLNEFEKVKTWYTTYTTRWEKSERELKSDYMYDEDQNIIQIYIISKSFWFIKWLVDNDKINWRRCLDLWYEISVIDEEGEDIDVMRTFDSYEQLLMYLSIQDNPIEFLVSVLK